MTSEKKSNAMNPDISKRLKATAKIEKEKESVKPTVINDSLIKGYLIQYNKENKIFEKNDESLWNLKHLALSYKNIIEIDNLTGLERLQKLQLDNNIICKIQKLDHLVNLEWLDLSFNLIEQIEGLGNLVKLTDLSLYSNKIKKLSGLENLCNLNVLSFGKNCIVKYADDEDGCINYLRKLKNKLEVLKMAENKFTNSGQTEGDYKLYAIEALKKLKYIDYELISEQQRDAAKQKYSDELQEKDGQEKGDDDAEVDPDLVKAHIDITIGMLKNIENGDADNSYFLKKLKDQSNLWQILDSQVGEMTGTFHQSMKMVNKEKSKQIKFCKNELHQAEVDAEQKSIKLITKYTSEQKHMLNELLAQEDKSMQIDDYETNLMDKIAQLEDDLMEIEFLLQEALSEATGKFVDEVKRLNSELRTKTMDYIKEVANELDIYSNNLRTAALNEQEAFEKQIENMENISQDSEFNAKLEVVGEREPLIAWLEQSKEYFDNQLADKERQINKKISEEWAGIEKQMTSSQYSRNRGIVKEIIETTLDFRKGLKGKMDELREQYENE